MSRKRRGRSEGSIYQRADGTWTASVSLGYDGNGKRRRKVVYGQSKKEVQEKLRKEQDKVSKGTLTLDDRMTVKEFLEHWLENTVKPQVAPTTHSRYEQHVRLHLVPHLGRVRIAQLTALHVEQLYAGMATAGASAHEQRKVGTALRTAPKHAVRHGRIGHNVAADVPKPKPSKKEIHPLDQTQAGVLLKAAKKDRLYALYVLALDAGMRQGELFGLQWPDIDFDTGSVQVQHSLEEIKGQLRLKDVKTAKARRRIDLAKFTRTYCTVTASGC